MHSLHWRLTLSHLLVALSVVIVTAALSPPLFIQYYERSEQRRFENAANGIARVVDALAQSGSRQDLRTLVSTSARVIGGGVELDVGGGEAISAGTVSLLPSEARFATFLTEAGLLKVSVPRAGAEQILAVQRTVTLWAVLIAIPLALLLAYTSAKATSVQLVQMSRAAEQLAGGNFRISIPERGPAEVKSLAASMNHMAVSLASLDGLRREFVASASHELRAPLTSIRGFLEALQDGTADSEKIRRRCLQGAAAEARRMTRLVEDLLQLSRLQAGVMEFEFSPTDLGELVRGTARSFEPRLQEKRVSLDLQTADVPTVMADGERLVQVLVNLLDNALRYSPEGSTITVRLAHEGCIVCSVRDQGPGIPEGDLASIFDRFHKADAARQVGDHGAGLGLAIAREIVLRHGGEVFARNLPEGGAEVGFRLPANAAVEGAGY